MTYDRAALDLVGAMTNAELADFIRQARQPLTVRDQLTIQNQKLSALLSAVDQDGNPTQENRL